MLPSPGACDLRNFFPSLREPALFR